MENNKIDFIICTNNKLYYEECIHYISRLEVPQGYEVDVLSIEDADYITKAYNEAMRVSNAKYKVYMHQDTFIINKRFLYDMLQIFEDSSVGMIGMVGCELLPEQDTFLQNGLWDKGRVYYSRVAASGMAVCADVEEETAYEYVQAVDGLLMATQYDVRWREDILQGWDFYDISQSMEFLKQGYQIAVPSFAEPWVLHDHGVLNYQKYDYWKRVFFQEYAAFLKGLHKEKGSVLRIDVAEDTQGTASDLYEARRCIEALVQEKAEATIAVVAYNRLEVTKACIKRILKYTRNIRYKLILVYNENEQGTGILEYFKSVEHEHKLVLHITRNVGAAFAYEQIMKHIEGKYFVHVPNDVIVTQNWLTNLIRCAESDCRIGMVNPVSSNVSNFQNVFLEAENMQQMQERAKEYNVTDPTKWQERLRLITLGTLFTRACLAAIGNPFDVGFVHDFGDDDLSFRVRRAGYKVMLAGDTWVHHHHDILEKRRNRPVQKAVMGLKGREAFRSKYFGIDAWDDTTNFVFMYIGAFIERPKHGKKPCILGIDIKCGTPILDIKNKLREYGLLEAETAAFTQDARYYIDLQTICDGGVVCDRPAYLSEHFQKGYFDYIIIGKNINEYEDWQKMIQDSYQLLEADGQMFVSVAAEENQKNLERFYLWVKGTGIAITLINRDNSKEKWWFKIQKGVTYEG